MYNETSIKRKKWQDEMVKNLKESTVELKKDTGGLLQEMKAQTKEFDLIMKPGYNFLKKKNKFKSRFKINGISRSKSRLVEKSVSKRRSSMIAGRMTPQEYNAAFDRMFRKKATRENVRRDR